VTDVLDEVLTNLYMYNIRSLRPEALEFAALIRKCCAAMKEMLEDFRNFRRSPTLKEKIITLNRLEEEGDQLIRGQSTVCTRKKMMRCKSLSGQQSTIVWKSAVTAASMWPIL
jgi:uncharacterized protein Yka (UPF0111/DUF47 family)